MQQEFLSQINSANQTAYDATKQLMDLNARTVEKLVQQQISGFEMCLQGGTKQTWDVLGEARTELTALFEKGVAAATDSVKTASVKKVA